jgi:hypothetical protein
VRDANQQSAWRKNLYVLLSGARERKIVFGEKKSAKLASNKVFVFDGAHTIHAHTRAAAQWSNQGAIEPLWMLFVFQKMAWGRCARFSSRKAVWKPIPLNRREECLSMNKIPARRWSRWYTRSMFRELHTTHIRITGKGFRLMFIDLNCAPSNQFVPIYKPNCLLDYNRWAINGHQQVVSNTHKIYQTLSFWILNYQHANFGLNLRYSFKFNWKWTFVIPGMQRAHLPCWRLLHNSLNKSVKLQEIRLNFGFTYPYFRVLFMKFLNLYNMTFT